MNYAHGPGRQYVRLFTYLAAGLALTAMFAHASPQLTRGAGSVRDEVRCVEIGFSRSVETRDREFFAAFLDGDARFIGSSVTRGASEVVDAWAPYFTASGPQLAWRPYHIEVAATGDIALSRGPFRLRVPDGEGHLVDSWGVYNSVWRRNADNRWRIIFDAGNAGENQVTAEMKALIDQPVENCDFESLRKRLIASEAAS